MTGNALRERSSFSVARTTDLLVEPLMSVAALDQSGSSTTMFLELTAVAAAPVSQLVDAVCAVKAGDEVISPWVRRCCSTVEETVHMKMNELS